MVDYARPNHPQSNSKKGGNTVATAAIAQAQWSNVCWIRIDFTYCIVSHLYTNLDYIMPTPILTWKALQKVRTLQLLHM